jgi:hypothetical protein
MEIVVAKFKGIYIKFIGFYCINSRSCIPHILCHDITLFTFDFSGCGNSEGDYISLGYY